MSDLPYATRSPRKARLAEDSIWDEFRPYLFQTVRNIATVVVSVSILAVGFRLYLWVETEWQMMRLQRAQQQAVQKFQDDFGKRLKKD